jgi:hypothetical protein
MPGLAVRQTRQAVRQLNEMGLRLVYVSPRGEEYLFVRETT